MNNEDFPKVFRKEQIESFVQMMTEAITFQGPNREVFRDEHIEMILEEVSGHEADLSTARVAIEKYIISSLAKDPDNVILMRIHDNIGPIIQEVINIEIKMYGAPKYVVTKSATDANAWRVDGQTSSSTDLITSVSLPQDVLSEIQRYAFVTVKPGEVPVLPDKDPNAEPDVSEIRRVYFEPLEPVAEVETEELEEDWYNKFSQEAAFEFIDMAIFVCGFHDQVSMLVTSTLKEYCLTGYINGMHVRTEKALHYERECPVADSDATPGQYIITAYNSSLRAFFTALQITSDQKKEFKDFIKENTSSIRKLCDYSEEKFTDGSVHEQTYERCISSLIKLYGKHPIFEKDLPFIKTVMNFIDENQRKHFYTALNDWASYYDEHKFYKSTENCYLLKEWLASVHEIEKEPTKEEVETYIEHKQQELVIDQEAQEHNQTQKEDSNIEQKPYTDGVFID